MISTTTRKMLDRNDEDLDRINQHRRWWLFASSLVFVGIITLIFAWDALNQFGTKSIWWVITSLMLILSVNWWYWTMRVMLRLISHQKMEFAIIRELLFDIKELKTDLKQLSDQTIDNKK